MSPQAKLVVVHVMRFTNIEPYHIGEAIDGVIDILDRYRVILSQMGYCSDYQETPDRCRVIDETQDECRSELIAFLNNFGKDDVIFCGTDKYISNPRGGCGKWTQGN